MTGWFIISFLLTLEVVGLGSGGIDQTVSAVEGNGSHPRSGSEAFVVTAQAPGFLQVRELTPQRPYDLLPTNTPAGARTPECFPGKEQVLHCRWSPMAPGGFAATPTGLVRERGNGCCAGQLRRSESGVIAKDPPPAQPPGTTGDEKVGKDVGLVRPHRDRCCRRRLQDRIRGPPEGVIPGCRADGQSNSGSDDCRKARPGGEELTPTGE